STTTRPRWPGSRSIRSPVPWGPLRQRRTKMVGHPDWHPGVNALLRHFEYDHLPAELRDTSGACHDLAHLMAATINDDPELTAGLRHLLEAKDCFVRARRVSGERPALVDAAGGDG